MLAAEALVRLARVPAWLVPPPSAALTACQSTAPSTTRPAAAEVGAGEPYLSPRDQVRRANDHSYLALNRMYLGEIGPMEAIWSHGSEVSLMGPFGGTLTGWPQVRAQFAKEASLKLGGSGGHVDPLDVRVYNDESGDMAYVLCVEQGENLDAAGQRLVISHRATNIFRWEGGQWKLVHHHTDLAPAVQARAAE